jgi:hypothetical protein
MRRKGGKQMNNTNRVSQQEPEAMIQENIAQIGMMIGFLIATDASPHTDLDLSSTDISQKVISWAKEFEDKYEGSDYDFYQSITELGKPDGYLDAIDNFTDLKLRDAGWLTEEYILDSGRFWNSRT